MLNDACAQAMPMQNACLTIGCYNEFCGAEVFSQHIRYLTIRPNDPEIGGDHAVPFN